MCGNKLISFLHIILQISINAQNKKTIWVRLSFFIQTFLWFQSAYSSANPSLNVYANFVLEILVRVIVQKSYDEPSCIVAKTEEMDVEHKTEMKIYIFIITWRESTI